MFHGRAADLRGVGEIRDLRGQFYGLFGSQKRGGGRRVRRRIACRLPWGNIAGKADGDGMDSVRYIVHDVDAAVAFYTGRWDFR